MNRCLEALYLACSSTGAVALSLAISGPAAAQERTSDAADTSDRAIVVTALRRAQSLSDVPASVTALDSAALESRQIRSLTDIQAQVPNVNFGTSIGTSQVSIRGVGLTINAPWGEPGVATHLDGAYETRPALSQLATFDLERIEILRGPQGTLYGRNATGGSINFISRAPTENFEGHALLSYGNFDEARAQLVLSGGLAEGVRARVGVTYAHRGDGFLENIRPGQRDADESEDFGARARLAFDLSPDASLDLALTYLHSDGSQPYLTAATPIDPALVPINPSLQGALAPLDGERTAADTTTLDREAFSPTATLRWNLGGVQLTSITAYTDIDTASVTDPDGTSAPLGTLFYGYTSETFSQELNLSGSSDSLDWIVGLYYLDEDFDAFTNFLSPAGFNLPDILDFIPGSPILPVFLPGGQTIQEGRERRSSYAAFADFTIGLTDRLNFFAGARYSRDEISTAQTTGNLPFPGLSCIDLETSVDFEAFTPRAGLQYDFGPSNIYASISRGYKAGGVNPGSCGNTFEPEKILAYEIGYRGQVSDSLTVALAGFHYDYTDFQAYVLRPITQGGGVIISNAPEARSWGFEGEIYWTPAPGLRFNGSIGYLDAEFEEYVNINPLTDPFGLMPLDLSGNSIPRSPEWTVGAGADYETAIGNSLRLMLRGELYHSSRIFFTEFNNAIDAQEAYTLFNAFVELGSVDRRYTLRLYGKNLSDERYFNFLTDSPLIGGKAGTYGPRRQFGVELIARF
ncbi:MAG: TonB-dependent receptor [Parasphingopyxis sp.]|uniref:TonB-dependent receptor n=1 Tax=Parasphingopyxis sp. TaxID=1920299 RepID=UPI003FA03FB5